MKRLGVGLFLIVCVAAAASVGSAQASSSCKKCEYQELSENCSVLRCAIAVSQGRTECSENNSCTAYTNHLECTLSGDECPTSSGGGGGAPGATPYYFVWDDGYWFCAAEYAAWECP